MADTIGLLKLSPKAALLELVNQANNLRLKTDFVEFTDPVVVEGRKTQVNVATKRYVNPFVTIPHFGLSDFTYNRLELGRWFANTKFNFHLPLPTTTRRLVQIMTDNLGYQFDDNDFVIEDITRANAMPYRLKAHAKSLRWVGEIDIELLQLTDLATLGTSADLGSVVDETQTPLPDVTILKPFTDGMTMGGYLDSLSVGMVDHTFTELPHVINRMYSGAPAPANRLWLNAPIPQANNLYGSVITHRGRADTYGATPINPRLGRLVVIQLNPTYCTNLVGDLMLYYNTKYPEPLPEFPIVYKKPFELEQNALSGYTVSNEIVQLYEGDVITAATDDWVIGNTVFNRLGKDLAERWVIDDTPRAYNAYGAQVIYNGYNRDHPRSYNPNLDYVLVLELSDTHCTNLRGRCYIHYNLDNVG